jgi:hypothetical protein
MSLCGGHLYDVQEGVCEPTSSDIDRLLCLCQHGRDESEAVLCAVDNGLAGGDPHTVTRTKTTTIQPRSTEIFTATRTKLVTTTEAIEKKTVTRTIDERVTSTVTKTNTLHKAATTKEVIPATATIFTTLTAFAMETLYAPTTISTTIVVAETSVSFSTAFATLPVFVTETSTAYATVTVTVIATSTDTEFTTIGATVTELETETDVVSVTVVRRVRMITALNVLTKRLAPER